MQPNQVLGSEWNEWKSLLNLGDRVTVSDFVKAATGAGDSIL